MSMLGSLFKSAFAGSREREATPVPPSEQAPPGDAPLPAAGHAWQALAGTAGIQQMHYPHLERSEIRRLLADPPRRVLDIGCSTGAVGEGLKKTYPGCWVWGCELNPDTAALAATRLDLVTSSPWESWDAGDLARLRTIDTVLLLDVLEHMYNPWGLLCRLSEHLPDDGQVIVSLPNIGHFNILSQLAEGGFTYEALGILDVTHIRFFTYREMMDMFRQTGFDVDLDISLTHGPITTIPAFPAQVGAGRLTLTVMNEAEWLMLNTVQFGFRLRPARPAARAPNA